MNDATTPTTDDDFRPSATLEEAVERLGATCRRRIAELEKQRDELAACLYKVREGFVSGRFTATGVLSGKGVHDFAETLIRIDAALATIPRKEQP